MVFESILNDESENEVISTPLHTQFDIHATTKKTLSAIQELFSIVTLLFVDINRNTCKENEKNLYRMFRKSLENPYVIKT